MAEEIMETEVDDDDSCGTVIATAETDLSDVEDMIEGKDYQEAADRLEEVIADLQKAHAYIQTQIK